MAQHDYNIANGTGSAVRSDLNNALAAIVSMNSGSTEPSTTFAFQFWADTNANLLKMRNSANDGWIELRQLDGEFTTVSVANGTAAAPSIFFNASGTDTGIYSAGTDSVDVSTGGTRRLDIGSGGDVTVRGGNVTLNAQGDLRLADSDSSNWVAFQAPATVASNVTWTLPSADGSNGQALTTNGSGTLSWTSAGGASITTGNTTAEVVDTGSDGHFKVTTEGTEALRVNSSQQVGINTNSPGAALDVRARDLHLGATSSGAGLITFRRDSGAQYGSFGWDSGSDLLMRWTNDSGSGRLAFNTNSAERARIDENGRLLAGTSTARSAVMFNATSTTPTHQLETATNSWNNGLSIINNSSGGYTATLRLGTSGGNSIGSYTTSVSELGKVSFHGADGTRMVEAARINCNLDGTAGNLDMPGRLMFSTTADGASSPTERMRIKNDGRIVAGDGFSTAYGQVFTAVKVGDSGKYFGIGDQGNSANAWSRDSGTSTYTHIQFANGNGSTGTITTSGTSTSYNTTSDYRLKENVVDLDGAIDRVKQLAPKRFNFIVDADTTVDGFLAHEVQDVVPEAISGEKDAVEVWQEGEELPDGISIGDTKLDEDGNTIPKYQGIDQAKLVPLLTAALQEAVAKIETLEAKVAALEAA